MFKLSLLWPSGYKVVSELLLGRGRNRRKCKKKLTKLREFLETDIVPRVTRGVRGPLTVRAWLPLVLPASLFGLMDPTLAPTPPLCLKGRPVQLHQRAPSSPIPFHLADGCGRGLFSPWNCAITVRQARWSVRFVTNQSKDLLPRSRWICFFIFARQWNREWQKPDASSQSTTRLV